MNPGLSAQLPDEFLDASVQVIRAPSTQIEEVCEGAGHFKSNEDLAIAAADHFGGGAEGPFANATYQGVEDPLDRLLGYIDFRGALLQGALPDFTCLLGTIRPFAIPHRPR